MEDVDFYDNRKYHLIECKINKNNPKIKYKIK